MCKYTGREYIGCATGDPTHMDEFEEVEICRVVERFKHAYEGKHNEQYRRMKLVHSLCPNFRTKSRLVAEPCPHCFYTVPNPGHLHALEGLYCRKKTGKLIGHHQTVFEYAAKKREKHKVKERKKGRGGWISWRKVMRSPLMAWIGYTK